MTEYNNPKPWSLVQCFQTFFPFLAYTVKAHGVASRTFDSIKHTAKLLFSRQRTTHNVQLHDGVCEWERGRQSGWKGSLCHVELASAVRDEKRSRTMAAQCDSEASRPLSTKHSISVGVPAAPQSELYHRYFREHKRHENTHWGFHLQTERQMNIIGLSKCWSFFMHTLSIY